MLKLKVLQDKRKAEKEQAAARTGSSPENAQKVEKGTKAIPAELIVMKDVSEMDKTPGIEVEFPKKENLMHFLVHVVPTDGLYKGAKFTFTVDVPSSYPFDPPKVHCETLVYHPNIDFEGHVCLNILRQDWTPVLSLRAVLFGLLTLFLEPNPDDPLNKDVAKLMIDKPAVFERNVRDSLRGSYVMGRHFPRLL
mmetsp:Transcript_31305/g.78558  ORF Transcript_31305/g.78558 Transcript_31305/m.78558 type:complete len:194 (+) Transcript_31305:80-661(+)|eukprot:CAMPEP_0177648456 /NCGR_PEP_ID=MMETSP0447-20121125/10838_1 /TAXON_ID=0 /ORGANISM="Stygamoeba regulata, Strain BSH-02190019" /LENGTH=193 /DNA_ID=CAMNT_0019151099 /DNA_START=334 /DNA_END=915 /DNA_ORIENTATION=-